MTLIPDWLKDYCRRPTQKKEETRFLLRCPCGCERFYYFKRNKTPEEELEEYLAYLRQKNDYPLFEDISINEKGEWVIRNKLFGFHWKERPMSDYLPKVWSFPYVSVKCAACGKEHDIFDGRVDRFKLGMTKFIVYGELGHVRWSKEAFPIECRVFYPEDAADGADFHRIVIRKKRADSKSLVILDWES